MLDVERPARADAQSSVREHIFRKAKERMLVDGDMTNMELREKFHIWEEEYDDLATDDDDDIHTYFKKRDAIKKIVNRKIRTNKENEMKRKRSIIEQREQSRRAQLLGSIASYEQSGYYVSRHIHLKTASNEVLTMELERIQNEASVAKGINDMKVKLGLIVQVLTLIASLFKIDMEGWYEKLMSDLEKPEYAIALEQLYHKHYQYAPSNPTVTILTLCVTSALTVGAKSLQARLAGIESAAPKTGMEQMIQTGVRMLPSVLQVISPSPAPSAPPRRRPRRSRTSRSDEEEEWSDDEGLPQRAQPAPPPSVMESILGTILGGNVPQMISSMFSSSAPQQPQPQSPTPTTAQPPTGRTSPSASSVHSHISNQFSKRYSSSM